jgi:transcriptional regulator with XRE-family HTH domain
MFCVKIIYLIVIIFAPMERINRIKEVLVIQGKSQKWLAEQLSKSTTAVTSFCNNKSQPHLKDLKIIAEILDVDIKDLLVATKE